MTQPYSSQDEHYSYNRQTKPQRTNKQNHQKVKAQVVDLVDFIKKLFLHEKKKKKRIMYVTKLFFCFLTCLFMTDSLTKDSQCCFESKHVTEVCDIFCPWHITVNYVSLHDSHPNKSQIV